MSPKPGLKTKGIPIEVTPDDYEFSACIDEECGTRSSRNLILFLQLHHKGVVS
jgi:hypothetical protein